MKRFISILLCCALLFGMSACSKPETTTNAVEMLSLGEKYLLDLNYEQALVQFLQVIEIEPMNPRGYIAAADAYIGLGDYENAAKIIAKGRAAGFDEAALAQFTSDADRYEKNLAFLTSGEVGINITNFYFDRDSYIAGRPTQFVVMVAYRCPEDEECIVMIGANTAEPSRYRMMDEDYVVTGSGAYQFNVNATPVQWGEEQYFGVYVNLSEADHAESWTPLGSDVLYIDENGNIVGSKRNNSTNSNNSANSTNSTATQEESPGSTRFISLLNQGAKDADWIDFESISLYGNRLESRMDITTMQNVFLSNGYNVEFAPKDKEDKYVLFRAWQPGGRTNDILAMQYDDKNYVSYLSYGDTILREKDDPPLQTIVGDICIYDSFETVLTKLGFSNAAEIGAELKLLGSRRYASYEEMRTAVGSGFRADINGWRLSKSGYTAGIGTEDGGMMVGGFSFDLISPYDGVEYRFDFESDFSERSGVEFSDFYLERFVVHIH